MNLTAASILHTNALLMWLIGLSIVAVCVTAIAAMLGFIPGNSKAPLQSAASAPLASVAPLQSSITEPPPKAKPTAPSHPAVHQSTNRPKPTVTAQPAVTMNQPTETYQAQPVYPPTVVQTPPVCRNCGYVETIHEVTKAGQGSGIGAVGGAVVGGLLGNQVGKGGGRDLATLAGVVGGVFAGNEIEKHVKNSKEYEISIRMQDGSSRLIHETNPPAWRVGDSVRVIDGVIMSN